METVSKRPDIYLKELVEDLREYAGIKTATHNVWRVLTARGWTRKKVGRLASGLEASDADLSILRLLRLR
jgi:hypothetical protein